jgi:hypothetical protein
MPSKPKEEEFAADPESNSRKKLAKIDEIKSRPIPGKSDPKKYKKVVINVRI